MIKRAIKSMLEKTADLGITHAEKELGLQPVKKLAREKQSLFPDMDQQIDDYIDTRSFWVTGIERQDILDRVTGYLLLWSKGDQPFDMLDTGLKTVLSDWLPERDRAGRIINVAHRTEVIVRTNLSDVYNYARYRQFEHPALADFMEGYQYSAIMDTRTTPVCRYLHGKFLTKKEVQIYIPPNHYNCRSILLPITVTQDVDFNREINIRGDLSKTKNHLPQKGFGTVLIN